MIKVTHDSIIIDREKLRDWLQGGPGEPVPWEEGNEEGYKTASGEKKPFPAPVDPNPAEEKISVEEDVSPDGENDPESENDDPGEDDYPSDSVDLFEEGPNGVGGTLQDAPQGADKIKEIRNWLKAEKFNYRNFCLFLHNLTEVAGWRVKTPVIGVTQKGEPSIFKLAYRYYTFWKSSKDEVARLYKRFLLMQLEGIGVKIELVKDILDGEEIDPKNLPKGIEVSV